MSSIPISKHFLSYTCTNAGVVRTIRTKLTELIIISDQSVLEISIESRSDK